MTLASGTKLGPYEIQSLLGVGGMGEVYRARDTRLQRTVAIKILPAHLSQNAKARERFDREARAISSLSHPNICHLYDVGQQDEISYLVMEYLEGETLADRLRKGALPLEQVLKYGIEICEGLEKAHRSGIVHRDLKPGNVMLTKSGAKLMDFGLAKPTAAIMQAGSSSASLATMTQPLTAEGTIMGTFQYMSPEQVEGAEADVLSDIFSLGAVLYEMVTGKRAFEGKTTTSTIAAILAAEPPPISNLQPMSPPALERVVKGCLTKDPDERLQTAHDVKLQLKWIGDSGSQANVPAPVTSYRKATERLAWAAVVVLAVTTIAFAMALMLRKPTPLQPNLGAEATLSTELGPSAVLSPDGTRLAFVANGADHKRRLHFRSLDQLQASVLPQTENASDPFFSPDGHWIAFFADGKLKKISVAGGAAVTLCDAPSEDRGGSWGEDGTIVFATAQQRVLSKVSSAGGNPVPLNPVENEAGEPLTRWPQILPGGKALMFTSIVTAMAGSYEDADIVVYSISDKRPKTVQHRGFHGWYVSSGHLVYMHEGTLFAVPFDLKRLEVTGEPVPILEGVVSSPANSGGVQFSFAENGTAVYVGGRSDFPSVSIYWMDREGKFQTLREDPALYLNPAFSPDGKRLALEIRDAGRTDIWVYEWGRDTLTRLTFAGDSNFGPIWTPDGQRITYTSLAKGRRSLYWMRSDGTGQPQPLTESKTDNYPIYATSWRPDGKVLVFVQFTPATSFDILTMSVEGDERSGWKLGEPKLFLKSPFTDGYPVFSPDGRWLAYTSDESGKVEVYVRPFPGPGGKWQISSGGGLEPKWSRNGTDLFYRTVDSKIMVVTYSVSGGSFHTNKPRLWSPGQFTDLGPNYNFDLHPDGKRFAVLKAPAGGTTALNNITFIFNFFDELRRKATNSQ